MSPEIPNQDTKQNPEQEGWGGQRWQYLILKCDGAEVQGFVGRTRAGKGFFAADEDVDPTVAHYNQVLKETGIYASRNKGNFAEVLRIVGNDGWELTMSMVATTLVDRRENYLLFKRPIPLSK